MFSLGVAVYVSAGFFKGGARSGVELYLSRAVFRESTRAGRTIASEGPRECIFKVLLSFETVLVRFIFKREPPRD